MEQNEFITHGYLVKFPENRKPFASQKAVISKVLEACKGKQNALLESPTGSGKVSPHKNIFNSFDEFLLFW